MSGEEAIRIYNKRGRGRFYIGDFEGALGDFSRAISLNPHCAEAYQYRGLVYRCRGELDNAIEDFSCALRFSSPTHEQSSWTYYHRAMTRLTRGDLNGALADLTAVIVRDPHRTDVYLSRAELRERLNDYKGAIEDYGMALRIDPELDSAYIRRGNTRRELGDLSGALADYSAAIRLFTADARVFLYRSQLRIELGEIAGALHDLENFQQWGGAREYGNEAEIARQIQSLKTILDTRASKP